MDVYCTRRRGLTTQEVLRYILPQHVAFYNTISSMSTAYHIGAYFPIEMYTRQPPASQTYTLNIVRRVQNARRTLLNIGFEWDGDILESRRYGSQVYIFPVVSHLERVNSIIFVTINTGGNAEDSFNDFINALYDEIENTRLNSFE